MAAILSVERDHLRRRKHLTTTRLTTTRLTTTRLATTRLTTTRLGTTVSLGSG